MAAFYRLQSSAAAVMDIFLNVNLHKLRINHRRYHWQSLRWHQKVQNLRMAARLKSLQQRGKHQEEAQARAVDPLTTVRRVIAAAQSSRKLLSQKDAIRVRLQSKDTIQRMTATASLLQTTNPIGNFAAVANYSYLNAGSDKQRRESEYAL
jgi:hypothetical protein